MTTITQNIADITGATDDTAWVFYTKELRGDSSGAAIVTTKKVRKYPVDGVLTVTLDPGPAVVIAADGSHYRFTVPESDSELWPLIQAAVQIPPATTHEELEAAVASWLAGQVFETVDSEIATQVPPAVSTEVAAQVPPAVSAEVTVQVPPTVSAEVETQVPPLVTTEINTQLPALADQAVAAEVASQVPPAVTADIESRNVQIVAGTTSGTVQWQAGAALGPEFPANAVLADGIGDAGAVGRSVVQATTQAEAQAAIGLDVIDGGTP